MKFKIGDRVICVADMSAKDPSLKGQKCPIQKGDVKRIRGYFGKNRDFLLFEGMYGEHDTFHEDCFDHNDNVYEKSVEFSNSVISDLKDPLSSFKFSLN